MTPLQVQHLSVDEGGEGQRLDNFLIKTLKGVPKTHVYRIIRSGEVRVNKGRAQADTRLAMGDEVRVPPIRMAEKAENEIPGREFPVLLEDEALLVIDKPAGVAVHGGSGVSFGVIEQLRRARTDARFLELVHRLDKETSGLLLLAKKRSALTHLQDQLRDRSAGKTYLALVRGHWPANLKVVDLPLLKTLSSEGERRVSVHQGPEAKRAISLVKKVQTWAGDAADPGFSLLAVTIKTGRTHQIRVHLAAKGYPIVGDEKYGDFADNKRMASQYKFKRMFLHAHQLRFLHPQTQAQISLECPLPAECLMLLGQLGGL